MKGIIINANREGYGLDQIGHTLTVGDLISLLSDFDENAPVYIGNDKRNGSWYTYGGIGWEDVSEYEEEE